MDHQDQASAASIDAPSAADGQLPEQSRHVLKGRADVERVRRRKLGMRLVRAIVVLGALDLWMVSRSARGMSPLPHLPHIDPLVLLPLLIILPVLALSLVMVLPLLAAKSPVRLVRPEQVEIGLNEIVGLDTQVDEVMRTLDVFLAYATFREHLGGNPRRGILFEGPPGTGKTYLAKAMAKQAGVPFLFISGPGVPVVWLRHDGRCASVVLQEAAQGGAQGRGRDRLHRGDRRDRGEPRGRRRDRRRQARSCGAEPVRRSSAGRGPGPWSTSC